MKNKKIINIYQSVMDDGLTNNSSFQRSYGPFNLVVRLMGMDRETIIWLHMAKTLMEPKINLGWGLSADVGIVASFFLS